MILATGLSQLSSAPRKGAKTAAAKPSNADGLKDAQNMKPPPVKTAAAAARGTPSVRAARHSISNATPQQTTNESKRDIATPLTAPPAGMNVAANTPAANETENAAAAAGGRNADVIRGAPAPSEHSSAAAHIASQATPGTHLRDDVGGAANANDPVDASPSATKTPGDAGSLDAASPGAAMAADALASVVGAAESSDAYLGNVEGATAEREQLYNRFAAAATPNPGEETKGVDDVGVGSMSAAAAAAVDAARAAAVAAVVENFNKRKATAVVDAMIPPHAAAVGAKKKAPAPGVADLFSVLLPPAKKRKPRRFLSSDQKTFVCGIGGCSRAYGSASSLCAHKRAHHPNWKEERAKQRELDAAAALAAGENAAGKKDEKIDDDDENEDKDGKNDDDVEEEEDEDESCEADVAGRAARKEGAAALDAAARNTHSGAWVEALAADTHGRLGALRRSRQRVQRGLRDARIACEKKPKPGANTAGVKAAAASAEAIAAAAAARLLQQMESALEVESERLTGWLAKLESIAALRMGAAGKVCGFSETEAAALSAEEKVAAAVAEQTARAIAAAASAAAWSVDGRRARAARASAAAGLP